VQESLEAHVDLVMFSGDKLLGGPQAGILVGRTTVIDRIKNHPLARAVRADKLCLAALAATLTHYVKGEALTHIPVWQMISRPVEDVRKKADSWASALRQVGLNCEVKDGQSTVGGGSLPGQTLATALVVVRVTSPASAVALLRANKPPVIARIEDDRLAIDPRTVLDRDQEELIAALSNLKGQGD
jgi:L-seryl-tRNA(Ser) seleniumtransferase